MQSIVLFVCKIERDKITKLFYLKVRESIHPLYQFDSCVQMIHQNSLQIYGWRNQMYD